MTTTLVETTTNTANYESCSRYDDIFNRNVHNFVRNYDNFSTNNHYFSRDDYNCMRYEYNSNRNDNIF